MCFIHCVKAWNSTRIVLSSVKANSKTSFHLKIFNIMGNVLQHLGAMKRNLRVSISGMIGLDIARVQIISANIHVEFK